MNTKTKELNHLWLRVGMIEQKKEVKLHQIRAIVEKAFYLCPGELSSKKRSRDVVDARKVATVMIRKHIKPQPTSQRIGLWFNQDHSTILHSIDKYNQLFETNDEFKEKANDIETKIMEL